jgi:hypothetical protein
MGSVAITNFSATTTNNNSTITGISPTAGLIPGVVLSSLTAGITVPVGTFIVSITGNTAVLSQNVSGSGTATFTTEGASDTSANGGGVVLKGTTDKSITWNSTTNAWTSTEHFDLATGKQYRIGNVLIASGSQIGPSTGSFALGAGVTGSSLTSVGTLTSLQVGSAVDNQAIFANPNKTHQIVGQGPNGIAALEVYSQHGNDAAKISFAVADNRTGGKSNSFEINGAGDVKINAGNLVIGTSSKGIDFSANPNPAGMTSELLDDYETGTFTPVWQSTATLPTLSYSTQSGYYVKIGRVVHFWIRIFMSSWGGGGGSGNIRIGGLPFTSSTDSNHDGPLCQVTTSYSPSTNATWPSGVTQIFGRVLNNSTSIEYIGLGNPSTPSLGEGAPLQWSSNPQMFNNYISGTYFV